MSSYRYRLQPYKTIRSRYTCPQCGKARKFTRYINTETNAYLAEHVGKCDRETSCGYHYTPGQYFTANPTYTQGFVYAAAKPVITPVNFIAQRVYQQTLTGYHNNNFVKYLYTFFKADTVKRLITQYHIGSSKHWPGATIFWQIDERQRIRTGKVMLYNAQTGKRVKQPYAHIAWAHKLVNNSLWLTGSSNENKGHKPPARQQQPAYNLQQCLFGQHLLNQHSAKPIALVESEKTAIIAAGLMPQYLWLATGSLAGLTYQKCKVLAGRKVMMIPDADGYARWNEKLQQLRIWMPETSFRLSAWFNQLPKHKQTPGMDIADWLLSVRPF